MTNGILSIRHDNSPPTDNTIIISNAYSHVNSLFLMDASEVTPTMFSHHEGGDALNQKTENTTSITSPTQTHNILQHSKAKKTLFLTTAATQQTFPQTPTQSLQQT